MKAFWLWRTAVFFLIISLTAPGCAASNDAITNTAAYPRAIERAKRQKRQMIMHSGVDTFAITSVQVARSRRQFTVHLSKLDSLYQATLTAPSPTKKYMRLVMADSTSYTLDEPHTIPLTRIARIELVQ